MNSSVKNEKQVLRKKILESRQSLTTHPDLSGTLLTIQKKIPKNLLAYRAFRREPNPEFFIKNLSQKIKVFLPVVSINLGEMNFYRWQVGNDLQLNRFGIEEPVKRDEPYHGEVAMVLVPGLAFDVDGYRIGYGGGYYDRFFNTHASLYGLNLIKVGLCFSHELLRQIPHEPFDQKVDYIVTENDFIEAGKT